MKKPRVTSKAIVAKAITTIAKARKDVATNRKKAGPKRNRSMNTIL